MVEMKSYPSFLRFPHFTIEMSPSHEFGIFAKKAIHFARNRESIHHVQIVQ
jgi:hypothetical protein